VYRESVNWAKTDPPVLDEILGCLRPGNTLVV
jgi:hypothetical protein